MFDETGGYPHTVLLVNVGQLDIQLYYIGAIYIFAMFGGLNPKYSHCFSG